MNATVVSYQSHLLSGACLLFLEAQMRHLLRILPECPQPCSKNSRMFLRKVESELKPPQAALGARKCWWLTWSWPNEKDHAEEFLEMGACVSCGGDTRGEHGKRQPDMRAGRDF